MHTFNWDAILMVPTAAWRWPVRTSDGRSGYYFYILFAGMPEVLRHFQRTFVPFVNRPFESEIHGTVNSTQFCCVLLVTWCYRVLLSCYLRPK